MGLLSIVGLILFVGFIGCAITSTIRISDMIEDINKVSPPADRENPLLGYPGKIGRIMRKHRMLYPESNRATSLRKLILTCFSLLVAAFALIFGRSFF